VSYIGEKCGLMKEQQMQFAQLPSIHHRGFSFICCVTVSKFYRTKDYDFLSLSGL